MRASARTRSAWTCGAFDGKDEAALVPSPASTAGEGEGEGSELCYEDK